MRKGCRRHVVAGLCTPSLQKYEFIRYVLLCSVLFPYFCTVETVALRSHANPVAMKKILSGRRFQPFSLLSTRIGRCLLAVGLLLSISSIFTACIDEERKESSRVHSENVGGGKKIPQFSVKMSDKSTFSSQLLSGHRAIVVFFYSGCGDCHRYLPTLNRFYESLRADPEGEFRDVRLICISRADNAERIAQYWADAHFSLPYAPETDRRVYDLFGAHRVPTTYIFDAQGVCVATYGDSNAPDESELRNALRKAK